MVRFRKSSPQIMKDRYLGLMQTIWSGAGQFLDNFYSGKPEKQDNAQVGCFKTMFSEIQKVSTGK